MPKGNRPIAERQSAQPWTIAFRRHEGLSHPWPRDYCRKAITHGRAKGNHQWLSERQSPMAERKAIIHGRAKGNHPRLSGDDARLLDWLARGRGRAFTAGLHGKAPGWASPPCKAGARRLCPAGLRASLLPRPFLGTRPSVSAGVLGDDPAPSRDGLPRLLPRGAGPARARLALEPEWNGN